MHCPISAIHAAALFAARLLTSSATTANPLPASPALQTNSATSQQCAAASEELSNQASKMRDMLSIYNLGSGRQPSGQTFEHRNMDFDDTPDRNEPVISKKSEYWFPLFFRPDLAAITVTQNSIIIIIKVISSFVPIFRFFIYTS